MQRLTNFLSNDKYNKSLPKNHMTEDIFLVSYPKSGNTWVRFLIANALKFHFQIDREVNFFTIRDIIPGIKGRNRNLSPLGPFGIPSIPRIIKSHAAYNPNYDRVIMLVRDPRDVIISYYCYLKNYTGAISKNTTISSFIRDKRYGIDTWIKHTESWLLKANNSHQIIRIFRYEEFIKDTKKNLWDIMDLIGIEVDNSTLEHSIKFSSKEYMRNSELKHNSTNVCNDNQNYFVRQGKVTKGESLSEVDKKFIEDYTRDIAQMIGYEY
ncbi:MAG: sulfotransferase domain-containing protein [Cyanobacteria bacterium P01_G01_bin.39]